jgi:hypothetical protein
METKPRLYFENQEFKLKDGRKMKLFPSYVANLSGNHYSTRLEDLSLEKLLNQLKKDSFYASENDEVLFNLKNGVLFDGNLYMQKYFPNLPGSIEYTEPISIKYLVGKEISIEDLFEKIREGRVITELNAVSHIIEKNKKVILTSAGAVRSLDYLKDGIRKDKYNYKLIGSFDELLGEFKKGNIGKKYWERNKV